MQYANSLDKHCDGFGKNLDRMFIHYHNKEKHKKQLIKIFTDMNITEHFYEGYRYKLRKEYVLTRVDTNKLKNRYPEVYKDCIVTSVVKPTIIRTRVK